MALANTRSRLRMTALYQTAAVNGALVAGTGNKIEDFGVGFFTKWGDGGVDLSPIGDLTKTQVYALAAFLGVPRSILEAEPSDGLFENDRTDQMQIGATYPELEWAMDRVNEGRSAADFEGDAHLCGSPCGQCTQDESDPGVQDPRRLFAGLNGLTDTTEKGLA